MIDGRIKIAAATIGLAGCMLLGNFDTSRCSSDVDCLQKGLRGGVCVDNECIPTDAGANIDSSTVPEDGRCKVRPDCEGNSKDTPIECVNDRCVVIENPAAACGYLAGRNAFDENTVLVGAYVNSLSGGRYAIELAVNEINAAGGLPGADGKGRSLAVLICNRDNPSVMTGPSANHLINSLRVPMVFGQMAAPELRLLAERAAQFETVLVTTLANDRSLDLLSTLQSSRVFFLVDELENLAPIYGPTLHLAEKQARKSTLNSPITVALLASSSVGAQALADKLQNAMPPILDFNVLDTPASPSFWRLSNVLSKYDVPGTSYDTAISELVAAAPSVIITVLDDEFFDIGTAVEKKWGSAPRPIWIASPLNRFVRRSLNDDDRSFWQRFVGVDFAGDRESVERYHLRSELSFPSISTYDLRGFNLLYDATWSIALSMSVMVESRPVADVLSTTLSKVLAGVGPDVQVGPASGLNPFNIIRNSGGAIRLLGTSGPFVVGPNRRRSMGASLYCVGGLSEYPRFYDVEYDSRSHSLSGPLSCW